MRYQTTIHTAAGSLTRTITGIAIYIESSEGWHRVVFEDGRELMVPSQFTILDYSKIKKEKDPRSISETEIERR